MSKEADSVAILLGEDVLLGDSSLPEEAERMAVSSGEGVVLGDSSQSQQQDITVDNHRPHMSIDELLKVIKGANGMPVLFVPSSDGRLAAVAVNGLHNLVPANHEDNRSDEKNQQAFRSWLLLLASLVATVTFTAGLTPPGGFWGDDKASHLAGTSILRDRFPNRYWVFNYSNTTAFFASFMVIGMLAKNKKITVTNSTVFRVLVGLCFFSLGACFVAGASTDVKTTAYSTFVFLSVGVYFSFQWFLDLISLIRRRKRSPESVA